MKGSSFRAPLLKDTGISALSLDALNPIQETRKVIPALTLQGNLDPEALYLPEKQLEKEVLAILNTMQGDPAYIFNLGHGVLPDVNYNNVLKIVSLVKNS